MRNIAVLMMAAIAFLAAPVFAQDVAAEKQALLAGSRQETIALGGHRFLIFSGGKAAYQYVYSIDLVEITDGVPHYDPLFIEEYDRGTGKLSLTNGVAFEAISYHFDPLAKTFNYTAIDAGNGPRFAYSYQLVGDTLKLEQVLAQGDTGAPITLFNATDKKAGHAQTH